MKLSIDHNVPLRQYEVYEQGDPAPLVVVPYLGKYQSRSPEAAAQTAASIAAYPALLHCLSRLINCPAMNLEDQDDESIEAQEEAMTLLTELGHD